MKTLLFLLTLLLALPAALNAQAPAGLSKAEADAYNAAYAAEMARLKAGGAPAVDPLAAPQKPGKNATKTDWVKYDNAVAAWNQRTTAAQQQSVARQQQQAADHRAAVAARLRENKAAAEAKEKAEAEAAYQRLLLERQTQAMEALAQAQQLELLRKLGKLPK